MSAVCGTGGFFPWSCRASRRQESQPGWHKGSSRDPAKLNGKVVIAWHRDMGLTVSRLQHYDHADVLQPESREYDSIVLNNDHKWKILAKVLWWIGNAP